MQTENLEGQESIFGRDSGFGKMSSALSQVGGTLKRVKKSLGRIFKKSSKRSSKLKNHTFMLLDLRPGAGNMLGAYWEYDPPWLGSFGTPNTSECPKDAVECSLWQILQATAPSRYSLSQTACLGILRRAECRGKSLPPLLEAALRMQAGLDPPAPISGEAKAYHVNQRNEGIDLDGVSGALMATQNLQMQTFITNPGSSQSGPQKQIAFAANQRDEVRDLHDVAGALQAQPGLKQQTFVAGFSAGAGASAGTIGYQEDVAPTLKGSPSGNCMERSNTNDYKQSVTAEANLRDMAELLAKQRQEKEPLIHCGVYLDIAAADTEKLRAARDTVSAQLVRSRMGADPLLLRQREGFLSANPAGGSQLANFAERVLPARSVANLYPMNYSGKTDPKGFFIGRDRFGSNIIVDFDRRAPDKTNASALILGNTGQGKSYLLKLLLCNVREAGKSVISLDSEHEMEDECRALGGCFLDYLSGQYRINLLEPRCWDDGSGPEDPDAPDAFRGTLLSQHISFLRDVFRVYKGFDTPHIDTLELMVERLYQKWNITDRTDFAGMQPTDYPILSDLYDAIQESYDHYEAVDSLYPREMLRDLLLGLHSMCRGADARFFNGHTNIDRSKFLVFCVKGLDNMAENLRNTLLFSLLSYMSDQLLTLGNSVAAIDELYLWLSDPTVITYIRNALKRVRKKESALFLASQNLEDFTQPGIRELTRPLFSIPVHQFIFNGGNVDKKFFMNNLQLEESEYALIRDPQRGSCLYKCGNERYLLQVQAPE